MATGEEVHEDPDGQRKQINPDGSVLMAETTATPPRVPQNIAADVAVRQVDPKELFAEHIERAKSAGNAIVSEADKRGSRKVVFEDGGKLVLTKEGIMIHKYADGKKDQCTPDGKLVTVCYRHTITTYAIDPPIVSVSYPPTSRFIERNATARLFPPPVG